MSQDIKRIAVMTSGGDAPGMNACIRAIVRNGTFHDLHIFGALRGYEGLVEGNIQRLETRAVGNIIHRGGTILKTSRCPAFRTKEGRQQAFETLQAHDIDALIAIGGNGTLTGAKIFNEEFDIPVIGVPGTIDNDLYGTDYTIGFDTAVNTAVEAMDKIRDTADSHNRLFFVEVMGRHSGFIALNTGIGSGAGCVIIPEDFGDIDHLVSLLKKGRKRKKLFSLVIVAEGSPLGSAMEIAKKVSDKYDYYDSRVTIIGHLQRGGSPTAMDRVLASRLGFHSVEGLLAGEKGVMVGLMNGKIAYTPFEEVLTADKPINEDLMRMAEILGL